MPSSRRTRYAVTLRIITALLAITAAVAAPVAAQTLSAADLTGMAESGRFDQLLHMLDRQAAAAPPDPRLSALLESLAAHQRNTAGQRDARLAAYTQALAEMDQFLGESRLEDALRSAIEANGLADDPPAMLDSPAVQSLVRDAEAQAAQAADAGQWLDALNIYRGLYYLFDDRAHYRDQVRHAERHVRLLRLYAPEHLKTLYTQRAQRLGKEDIEPPQFDDETWEQRLEGVRLTMFWQSLVHAAHKHVSASGYNALLLGSIDALEAVTAADGLEAAFEGLADKTAVENFRKGLAQIRRDLDERLKNLNYAQAMSLFDRIEDLNRQTVRLPRQVLAYEMADGAMATLDEFSAVIWPREMEQFTRNTSGRFFGVGIQISKRDGQLVVITPLPGTPAQRAGLKAGDIITKVGGRDAASWSLDRAVREITGPQGTTVTLTVERLNQAEPIELAIKRDEIPMHSVLGWQRRADDANEAWDYYIDRDFAVGYLRVSNFLPQTADDIDAAINQMQADAGLEALILDLRFNPGGLLQSAVDVCDRFIRSGAVVSIVDSSGQAAREYRARPDRTHPPMPLVVLINQGSASAAEIVAGALQDHHRALIVGQRSFGKGSVQDLFNIGGGQAYLKLTTQYYQLPDGRIIHRQPLADTWGVDPDLTVKMTDDQVEKALQFRQDIDIIRDPREPAPADEDGQPAVPPTARQIIEQGLDPQLATALLILQTRLAADQLPLAQAQTPAPVAGRSQQ